MEHNMLGVAIFCGLYYAFAGWRPLYLTHSIWLFPLTSALPIGLLMGDVKGAMILGAAISMLYVGLIAPGAEISADAAQPVSSVLRSVSRSVRTPARQSPSRFRSACSACS